MNTKVKITYPNDSDARMEQAIDSLGLRGTDEDATRERLCDALSDAAVEAGFEYIEDSDYGAFWAGEDVDALLKKLPAWAGVEVFETKSCRIVFADNSGSYAVSAVAGAVDGCWRNSVQRFDGEHDLAYVDVPSENAEYLKTVLEEDDNVISYEID